MVVNVLVRGHMTRLEEGSLPADYWAAWAGQRFNPPQMLENWVADHRKKIVPLD